MLRPDLNQLLTEYYSGNWPR